MSDDTITLTFKRRGSGTRYEFVPRSDGRYDLIEQTLTKGGDWREVGHDVVESVAIETTNTELKA